MPRRFFCYCQRFSDGGSFFAKMPKIGYPVRDMATRLLAFFLLLSLGLTALPSRSRAESISFNTLLSDEELTNTAAMSREELQIFLSRGSLATYQTTDVEGALRPAADILWRAAQEFRLNPRALLVLLQREQSLVEDNHPTQDQLDWAMGYAICDDCSKNDPALQKYRGFGAQVYYAAKRIRESYLGDLHENGQTISGVGPGIPTVIDGVTVTPTNKATAALYTYTPHLHGNENFVRIWRRWFVPNYPNGTLLQNSRTGGVWLIRNGVRRPLTSRAALSSRYNARNIISVEPSLLEAYPPADAVRFSNYSLLKTSEGTIYLLVDDTLRRIPSPEAFRSLGFVWDDVENVTDEELTAFDVGTPLGEEIRTPPAEGRLLQNNKTGGVYWVEGDRKHPIVSREILAVKFLNKKISPVDPASLETFAGDNPVQFPDGTLVGVRGTPEVYVISDGRRRHIKNEEAFRHFGWRWDRIVWTDARSLELHPSGPYVAAPTVEDLSLIDTASL
jgi:hypothetical protein